MPEDMFRKPGLETEANQKQSPAISELQSFSSRYNIKLTEQEVKSVVKQASEKRTETAIRKDVRDQLFVKLAEQNPTKAIEVEINFYKSNGYKVSPNIEDNALAATSLAPLVKPANEAAWNLERYRAASDYLKKTLVSPKIEQKPDAIAVKPAEVKPATSPATGQATTMLERLQKAEALAEKAGAPPLLVNPIEGRILTPGKTTMIAAKYLSGEELSATEQGYLNSALSFSQNSRAVTLDIFYNVARKDAEKAGDKAGLEKRSWAPSRISSPTSKIRSYPLRNSTR